MSNKRPDNSDTPDKWHWAITPEQIEKIKANDRDTINQVYFDNLDKFKRIARKYCFKYRKWWAFGDMVNQIYLDLPYYKYMTAKTFYRCIRNSIYNAIYINRCAVLSLDKLLSDDSTATLITMIPAPEYDPDKDIEYEKSVKRVLQGIARQQISEHWRDRLTATALNIPFYAGVFKYEYELAFAR
ncbi:MAG: hypothetical protein HDT28_00560 [Clostridiales bacterium]|nr:hypothetical protein [Clostridiales bacterium]